MMLVLSKLKLLVWYVQKLTLLQCKFLEIPIYCMIEKWPSPSWGKWSKTDACYAL